MVEAWRVGLADVVEGCLEVLRHSKGSDRPPELWVCGSGISMVSLVHHFAGVGHSGSVDED